MTNYTQLILRHCLVITLLSLVGFTHSYAQSANNDKVGVLMGELGYKSSDQHQKAQSLLLAIAEAALKIQESRSSHNGTRVVNYNSVRENVLRAAVIKGMADSHRITAYDQANNSDHISYKVDGTVLDITTKSKNNPATANQRAYTTYKTTLSIALQVKDAQTGSIVLSPNFNVSEYEVIWTDTQEKAMSYALDALVRSVTKCFNKWMPVSGQVLEGATAKGDKQKDIYVNLGSKNGAKKGMHLDVFSTKIIAGHTARNKVGRLKIDNIQGDDISLCKVVSGAKEIKAAIDANTPLSVESTD